MSVFFVEEDPRDPDGIRQVIYEFTLSWLALPGLGTAEYETHRETEDGRTWLASKRVPDVRN